MGLVQDWTVSQWDWHRMGLRHNGTGTELDSNTIGLVQDGTVSQWNW